MFKIGERVLVSVNGECTNGIVSEKLDGQYIVKLLDNSQVVVMESQINKN